MTKAIFSEQQPPLRTFNLAANMIQYQICVHEEIIETTVEETEETLIQYQYDFAEFVESTEYLNPDDVAADPEAYLNYVPVKPEPVPPTPTPTIREEIDELKERAQIAEDAIIELAELIGGE